MTRFQELCYRAAWSMGKGPDARDPKRHGRLFTLRWLLRRTGNL